MHETGTHLPRREAAQKSGLARDEKGKTAEPDTLLNLYLYGYTDE